MRTRRLLHGALIAAIYAAVTIAVTPLSYGPMQIRFSEALTVLPALTPAAVPGLCIGCLVANMLSPYGAIDIICGSIATLIGAATSYALRSKPYLVPLPPVICNGVIVGAMLHFAYGVPNLVACMGWVALGEFVACYVIGYPLLKVLARYTKAFR